MPTSLQSPAAGVTAAEVDAALPRGFFVKRGDIMAAFGLGRRDIEALVPEVFKPAPIPPVAGKRPRDRFIRSQVLEVARSWERRA